MRKLIGCAALLSIVFALPALAETLTLTAFGYTNTYVGGSGYYEFDGTGSLYNRGVPDSSDATGFATFSALALPAGAVLTNASLSWNLGIIPGLGVRQVGAARTETDYYFQDGVHPVCTAHGFLGDPLAGGIYTCIAWEYVPDIWRGWGGTATILDTSSADIPTLNFNDAANTRLALSGFSGSVDLLSAGLANALLASPGLALTAAEHSSLSIAVTYWGVHATTYYYPSPTSDTMVMNATLDVSYDLPTSPAPVPEPASLALLSTGVLGIGIGTCRCKLR